MLQKSGLCSVLVLLVAGCAGDGSPRRAPRESLAGPLTVETQAIGEAADTETSVASLPLTLGLGQALTSFMTLSYAGQDETGNQTPGEGEGEDAAESSPRTPWSLRGGVGFTLDPDSFLMSVEADYAVNEHVRVGPLLQFGIEEDTTILAPSVNVQYVFDLSELSEELTSLKPFVQGGVGFAYIHKDRKPRKEDDVGFMFNFGFGFEYELTEKFALGNNVLFNILPTEVADEDFFFSWQFVTARFSF